MYYTADSVCWAYCMIVASTCYHSASSSEGVHLRDTAHQEHGMINNTQLHNSTAGAQPCRGTQLNVPLL